MRIFVLGYPGDLGGADTELWHVLKLWRSRDLPVTAIPTWVAPATWRKKCNDIGVKTVEVLSTQGLRKVPDLRGSIVVSFCNDGFLLSAPVLRDLECKLVWANCMTWLLEREPLVYHSIGPFDAYVFQSRFQATVLYPQLKQYGVQPAACFQIPGAFDAESFAFRPRPHSRREKFVVGRLARADPEKWHANTWQICQNVPFRPIHVRLMGWRQRIAQKLGPPPPWATVLPPRAESSETFLHSLHTMLSINGGARENWPRIGLEAMATGVPVVTQDAWGWREMIEDGRTGFLAATDERLSQCVGRLAKDERYRKRIISQAREKLWQELANPTRIWNAWCELFDFLEM